jgi:transposase
MSSRSKANKTTETTRRERRKFSTEFKQEAVRLMYERRTAGVSMTQIAHDLEVRPEQLREWARQLGERPGVGLVETPEQELRRLRRENALLKQEREFAKNWSCAGVSAIC